jgi:hypothetical protein
MLMTFVALVLGLLTSSVKSSFDKVSNDVRGLAMQLIQLDRSLHEWGAETQATRELLRTYTATSIATTWIREPKPPGSYYPAQVPTGAGSELESSVTNAARADQFCTFDVENNPTLTEKNPLGVKGGGEAGTIAAIPAVMNAVNEALARIGAPMARRRRPRRTVARSSCGANRRARPRLSAGVSVVCRGKGARGSSSDTWP